MFATISKRPAQEHSKHLRKQNQEMERQRLSSGNMKCLDLGMPETSANLENAGYVSQEISLFT